MKCESVKELAGLYLYGELAGQEEEDVEQHLHGCGPCRTELDRQKALHRGLDAAQLDPPPDLLAECRRELFRGRPIESKPSAWTAFILFFVNFIASIVYLVRRTAKADIVALVTAEVRRYLVPSYF